VTPSVGLTELSTFDRDPACKLVYRDIHSSSHSNRKALQVQWSKPQDIPPSISLDTVTHKSNTLVIFASMELVSAKTPQQAEGFISTFVLFLISASDPKCSKAYLRLPPTWMGVWVEFVNTKKQQDDRIDKASVQILKRLIEENKCNTENDVALASGVRKRGGTANQTASTSTGAPLHSHEVASADQLKGIWARKASGNSFKHMVRFRMNLPVWGYKQDILDILKGHQAIIICSETGSGKSTQIPSFILAQELANGRSCKIYVTEPRRISAISLARRVSEELGENKKDVGTSRSLVGYSIRLESKICQSTRLVYAYVYRPLNATLLT
jgi:ATP-dependent RNA helicase DHX29